MGFEKFKRWLIGLPLPSHKEHEEKLSVPLGLAVFSSDALSSTAYATDEILIALAASPYAMQAGQISLPVAIAIAILIGLVVLSYRQVIRAYPEGGGAYVVARQNLGVLPSHIAASALLIDYILTVAVSISAGVAAITSTGVVPHKLTVFLCVVFTIAIMVVNLRGIRESGKAVAIPAFTFVGVMLLLVVVGIGQLLQQGLAVADVAPPPAGASVDWTSWAFILVFLNAFSHGCAGLTGIEAVSNGVSAFREPAASRANTTMGLMGVLLAAIFLGVTWVASGFHIMPVHGETIVSQVARQVFGGGSFLYYLTQIATMVILVLAANTAFAGFPRVCNLLADDGYLPRQLMNIGDRLVFSNGILILGFLALVLILMFHGDTHLLIPLYAVGVFISFTLSQVGMVVQHRRERGKGWLGGAAINGVGGFITGLVLLIIIFEKFTEGAWIIMVALPAAIILFRTIHAHYRAIARQLALPEEGYCTPPIQHTVLVLVSSLNRGTIPALEYARTIAGHVEAVHVALNPAGTERLKNGWEKWGCGIPLTVLPSPYRSIVDPVLKYIDEVDERYGDKDVVTVIIPEFVTKKFWHNFLHNQTSLLLKTHLMYRKNKVVTTIRYHLDE